MDIINHQIGTIEGSKTFSVEAIKKEDVDQIYALGQWRDSQKERDLKESIELYDRKADSND